MRNALYFSEAVIAISILVSGCASHIPVLPVLAIDDVDCNSSLVLENSSALKFDAKEEEKTEVRLTKRSKCQITSDGKRDLYVVLSLPRTDVRYTLFVSALSEDTSIFSPHITLLDANGNSTREILPEAFLYRGAGLTALVQPHTDEQYAVVSSDHRLVGQKSSRLIEAVAVNTIVSGPIIANVYTGSEHQADNVFSYVGLLNILISPVQTVSRNE